MPTDFAHDVEDPGILVELELNLLVTIVHTQNLGPSGPRVVHSPSFRRWRQDLKGGH